MAHDGRRVTLPKFGDILLNWGDVMWMLLGSAFIGWHMYLGIAYRSGGALIVTGIGLLLGVGLILSTLHWARRKVAYERQREAVQNAFEN